VPSRLGLADLASLAFDAVVQDVQIFPVEIGSLLRVCNFLQDSGGFESSQRRRCGRKGDARETGVRVHFLAESTIWDGDMVPYTNRLMRSILPSICWAITTRTGQSTNTTSCGVQSSAVFAGAH